ncbi:MAG: alpha/beta fold hydrolase [Microbacterium sp.]|uniref:alpha/beta fold hydrolase n=1 Tax=Microbacterium sp. TaxID=51671 RepID=UPI003F9E5A85
MDDQVGSFTDDATRAHFLRAFDSAMATWPEREDHRVETSFGATMVSLTGPIGERAPVVLVQGGGSTIASWAPFAEAWRDERPVIAIDTVWDAGRSVQSRPVRSGAEAAAWLEEVLAALEVDRAHLVGYSYGGWVALNHAVHAPGRLLSVTAIEPPGAITGIPLAAWWRMLWMLFGDERQHRAYLKWVRGGRLPESAMLDVMIAARTDFVQRGTPRPTRITKEQWAHLAPPATVVLGGTSRFISTNAATAVLRRDAPQVDVDVLSEAGHAVLVDEPDRLIENFRLFARSHDRTDA